MTNVYHWMRWNFEKSGFREGYYPACGAPMAQDTLGYGVYTDYVTCEVCKLWLLVNMMAT